LSQDSVLERMREAFPSAAERAVRDRGQLSIDLDPGELRDVAAFLREDPACAFQMLSSVSGVDYPDRELRLCVVYQLHSLEHNHRLRLRVSVSVEDPHVPSLTDLWPTADWHEREVYDFFGVVFDGHPNLERILMPDDWVGHPHRKDYPLGGVDVKFTSGSVPPADVRRASG
jgi:NADH-quinone oxidoreductase subunit C